MKYLLTITLAFTSFLGFSQQKLPLIKANANLAKIYEQEIAVSNWGINPKLKLDIHSTGKLTGSIRVKFKTDIDSISFKIAPR